MRILPWIFCLLAVVGIGYACHWHSDSLDHQVEVARDKVKEEDDRITLIKADIPMITKRREERDALLKLIPSLQAKQRDEDRLAQMLAAVEQARPPKMVLLHVKLDKATISVAAQGTDMARFQSALSQSPFFSDVHAGGGGELTLRRKP